MNLKRSLILSAAALFAASSIAGCTFGSQAAAKKPLVVYYTWSPDGNTKVIANMIREKTGADIVLIEPVKPYSTKYETVLQEGQRDLAAANAPAIKPISIDLEKYDPIYVGSPIWFGTFAPPVRTFLQSVDLTNKTIAPFCTHGRGGPSKYFSEVGKASKGGRQTEGFSYTGEKVKTPEAAAAVDAWLVKVNTPVGKKN